jgi:hypothetical protein
MASLSLCLSLSLPLSLSLSLFLSLCVLLCRGDALQDQPRLSGPSSGLEASSPPLSLQP